MRKFDWRDYVIIFILGLVSVMAFFTLIDWTIEKDNIIGIGNIVTFVGSLVGGGLTLSGVIITINHTNNIKRLELLPDRIANLDFIITDFKDFKEILEGFPGSYEFEQEIAKNFNSIKKQELLAKAIKIDYQVYKSVKLFLKETDVIYYNFSSLGYRAELFSFGGFLERETERLIRHLNNVLDICNKSLETLEKEFY